MAINKLELMDNGTLKAIGTVYFAKSDCGGKPHWVFLRAVYHH